MATLIGILIAQAALQIYAFNGDFYRDFRFWATVINILALAVISCVQYIEHSRARQPNGVVLVYWLLFIIGYGVKLRSLAARKGDLPYFVLFCVSFGLAGVEFVLEWLVAKQVSDYDALGNDKECPKNYATIFSLLAFSWMSPTMKYGYKHFLTHDDLWNLPPEETSNKAAQATTKAWERQLKTKKPSLWIALFAAHGSKYARGTYYKICSDSVQFLQPVLLRYFINFVQSYETDHPEPVIKGVVLALCMFTIAVVFSFTLNQYFQEAWETAVRVRSGLVSMIYHKSIRLSNEARSVRSTGDIVNHMAVDTDRLSDLVVYGQQLWSAPCQVVICMALLVQLLGYSAFAGVAVMVAMIPVNAALARLSKRLQKQQMELKDARTRLMTETLENMKAIKLYAWTTAFMNKLEHLRNDQELGVLRKIGVLQALINSVFQTTPLFVAGASFAAFVMVENRPLSTDLIFPALALFNMLGFPLAMFPIVVSSIVEASNSVDRLTTYFSLSELQPEAVLRQDAKLSIGDEAVRIVDARFAWDSADPKPALDNIHFSARKGELSCIIGRVGAGKSSLLQAMLGDMYKVRGEVVVRGNVAYVAQSPWIMNASVQDNILFGHRWDKLFYERTIKACALSADLAVLPDGDQTEVGERGISLSGGQKARLTLARAVYARADIYLLDDILSAVDQHVGRHIIENVIGPNGLLKSKTRILATNSTRVLMEANFLVLLRDGKVLERGTYEQLMAMKGEVSNLMQAASNEANSSDDDEEDVEKLSSDDDVLSEVDDAEAIEQADVLEELQEGQDTVAPIKPGATRRRISGATLRRASTVSYHAAQAPSGDNMPTKSGQTKEGTEQGKVKWSVYLEYAKATNLVAFFFYLSALVGALGTQLGNCLQLHPLRMLTFPGSNLWLKYWAEFNDRYGGNNQIGKFVGVYVALGVGSALLILIQSLLQWQFCSIEASRKMHDRMAFAIFRSPMSFFETTPVGRILNRFTSDVYRVDDSLGRSFNMCFTNVGKVMVTIIIISISTPAFVLVIIPLAAIYKYMQGYYLATSRELKRLESVSKSPVFAHFKESLNGLSTIRAYRQEARFAQEDENKIDTNMRAWMASATANRWLAVRLEFIGALVLLGASVFAVVSVSTGSGLSAGLVGLALSYGLQITASLNWLVRMTVEVENNIVSVERILEYAALPSEAPEVISKNRPTHTWPAKGGISFAHYSTRYREGLDLVLKDISLDIKPREKIGVVGRTGAGKSSLTLALFRIIEAAAGDIEIDGIGIGTIGLMDLRRRLSIIPQDAAMFQGTIRDNLDPSHVHEDTELWTALCEFCENKRCERAC